MKAFSHPALLPLISSGSAEVPRQVRSRQRVPSVPATLSLVARRSNGGPRAQGGRPGETLKAMYLITPAYTARRGFQLTSSLGRKPPRPARRCSQKSLLHRSGPPPHRRDRRAPLPRPAAQEGSLADVADECTKLGAALPPGVVLRVLSHVAEGLEAMHTAFPAVAHRDIKPHNVLVEGVRAFLEPPAEGAAGPREDALRAVRLVGGCPSPAARRGRSRSAGAAPIPSPSLLRRRAARPARRLRL